MPNKLGRPCYKLTSRALLRAVEFPRLPSFRTTYPGDLVLPVVPSLLRASNTESTHRNRCGSDRPTSGKIMN
jgi:hypothetical protein